MVYLIAVLVIAAFIGGIAVFKHRAKLKAATAAELKKAATSLENKL